MKMVRRKLQRIQIPEGNGMLEEKELLMEIETLKTDLNRLISDDADFDEIYRISKKLDRSIVGLYRIKAGRLTV